MRTPEEGQKPSGVTVTPEVKPTEARPKVLFTEGLPQPEKGKEEEQGGRAEPKVLSFGAKAPTPEPDLVKGSAPKVLSFGAGKTVSQAAPASEHIEAAKPKIVLPGGITRKRIEVSPYELRTTIAGLCEEAVIVRAIEIIKVTNLDDGRDDKVVAWGAELQQKLSVLLDDETRIVRSDEVEGSKRDIASVYATLKGINISDSVVPVKEGLFASLARRVTGNDPKARFEASYQSLQSTVKKLEARLPELRKLVEAGRKLLADTKALEQEVEATIIAGNYLVYFIRSGKCGEQTWSHRLQEQMDTLDQRVESLGLSQTTLKMSAVQREFLVKTMAHIIDCVQNTLLVDIPAWRTNYLFVLSAIMSGNQPDGSVLGEVITKQQKILERIQV